MMDYDAWADDLACDLANAGLDDWDDLTDLEMQLEYLYEHVDREAADQRADERAYAMAMERAPVVQHPADGSMPY